MTLVQEILEKTFCTLGLYPSRARSTLNLYAKWCSRYYLFAKSKLQLLYTQTGSLKHNEQALKYDI